MRNAWLDQAGYECKITCEDDIINLISFFNLTSLLKAYLINVTADYLVPNCI